MSGHQPSATHCEIGRADRGIMRVIFDHLRLVGRICVICSVIEALCTQFEEPRDHLHIKQKSACRWTGRRWPRRRTP